MKHIYILILLIFFSCTTIYKGGYAQPNFSLKQPNQLNETVENWEDACRTTGKNSEFEWWYFDTKLENGSLLVCYFYKVHFLQDKYFIGLNYTKSNGENIFKIKYFKKNRVSFSKNNCNVTMGNNFIRGNLNTYHIKLDPDDFDGFGINIKLNSSITPYRPQDGIIKAGKDYFAWIAAVPNGKTSGTLYINNTENYIKGDGYHDHNWGNLPLQKLFDGWVWFRGTAGDYTIIASQLNVSDERGGYDIPILFVANNKDVIINRFADNGVYMKKSNLIDGVYPIKNEPLFSSFKFFTENGEQIHIHGRDMVDNTDILKRMGMILPFRWAFNIANIDPYYTRFDSELVFIDSTNRKYFGSGFLEIMDLK